MKRACAAHLLAALVLSALPSFAAGTAVLSFAHTSNDRRLDWIGESIAENLREVLDARGLPVIARDRVREVYTELRLRPAAELTRGTVLKAAEYLHADHVLYGTYVIEPSRPADSLGTVTIRARISSPGEVQQSPWLEETGAVSKLGSLQAHLAWRALALLAPKSAPPEAEFESLVPAVRLDAEESYVRALMAPDPIQKEALLRQAAKLDARFWRPGFELGRIHMARKEYKDAISWFAKVDASDSRYREARFYIGLAKFNLNDFEGAGAAFETAAKDRPTPEVLNNLGATESRRNIFHALDSFARALEAAPHDPDYHFNLAYMLWKTGQYEAAAARFRAVLDRDPNDQMATLLLGRSLQKQGPRSGQAIDARLKSLERVKDVYEEPVR